MSIRLIVNPGGTPPDSTPAAFKAATNADGVTRWIYCQLNTPPTVTALRNRMDADTKLFGNLGWYYHIVTGPQSAKQPYPSDPLAWAHGLSQALWQLGTPLTVAVGNEISSLTSSMTATQLVSLYARVYDALYALPDVRLTTDGLSFEAWVMLATRALALNNRTVDACALYNAALRYAPPTPMLPYPLTASNINALLSNKVVDDPSGDRGIVQYWERLRDVRAYDAVQVHWYGPSDALPLCLDWICEQLPDGLGLQLWEHGLRVKAGYSYDPAVHAQYVAQNITLMLAAKRRDWLPLFETVAASPFCSRSPDNSDEFKGYADYQSYNLRPAGKAFQQVALQVQGGSAMTQVDTGDARVNCYWFTDGNGQKVYVVWTTGEMVAVPLGAGATITAIDGAVTSVPITVQAGPSPMFVRLG